MARYWHLLRLFVRQDLSQRYTGNLTGVAWVALAPLLQLALFALVFVHIFKARVPGLEGGGYVAFLALGMWPWVAMSEAISRGCGSIVEQAGLLDKVATPTTVLVAARVTTPFLLHGAGFVLVVAALAAMGTELHWRYLPLAVLAWLPLFALALGIGMIAAVLQVFIRDLAQILGYLLSAWMFLSPIFYVRSMTPAAMQGWFDFNPVAGLIETIRDSLLFGEWNLGALSIACLSIAVIAALSLALHHRLRPHLRDFL